MVGLTIVVIALSIALLVLVALVFEAAPEDQEAGRAGGGLPRWQRRTS